MSSLTLTMVTHACIKVEGRFGALLCDPWFLNEPIFNLTTWKFPAARMPAEQVVEGVTHLFISHSHEDHFHIPSIDLLPRSIEVLLPEYSWHPGLRAQTVERTLRVMGFSNIRKLQAWETVSIGEDARVTMVPAAAQKPHDWENAALVIEGPDTRILNLNDNPSDDDLYRMVTERFGHFDVVLVQYAGVTIFPGRFKMTEEEMREAVRVKRTNFAEQERAARLLSFDHIVPFAGDFAWLDDRLLHCNWACRATPELFRSWLADAFPEKAGTLMLMQPSDRWSRPGGLESNHPPISWAHYLDEIAEVKARFQPKVNAINAWMVDSDTSGLEERTHRFMETVERWVGRQDIDFTASVRIAIERPQSFSFVLAFDPQHGMAVLWDAAYQTDQTLYLQESLWASILDGKLSLSMMTWPGVIDQHVPFRIDIARMWFWTEYYLDINNRSGQVLLETMLHPDIRETVRPRLGVFEPA